MQGWAFGKSTKHANTPTILETSYADDTTVLEKLIYNVTLDVVYRFFSPATYRLTKDVLNHASCDQDKVLNADLAE